jgi:hypothetical protein
VSTQFQCWSCVDPVSLGLCGNPGCVSTLDRVVVCQHSIRSPFNEIILGWVLESTHIVTRLLSLMNFTCRVLSTVKT